MKEYETVILAEKPSQAKAYASAFSNTSFKGDHTVIKPNEIFKDGAIIVPSLGHLLEIPKPGEIDEKWNSFNIDVLPINPPKIVLKVKENTKDMYKVVEKYLKDAKKIIVAVDFDREGENIAWSLIEFLGINANKKTITRMISKSFEKDAVLEGFKNQVEAMKYYPKYLEARTRMFSDYLIGMNLSTLYSYLLGQQLQKLGIRESQTFSLGRVQSPTLALIYLREQEIENFKQKVFFEKIISVKHPNGTFEAKTEGRYENKVTLEAVLTANNLTIGQSTTSQIKSVTTTLEHAKSPKLFTLSNLQNRLNKKYKYSPNKSMKIIQGLYEKKFLTYPRTAISYITDAEYQYLKDNFKKYTEYLGVSLEIQKENPSKKQVDNSKVFEHFAIVPTKTTPKPSELTPEEKIVYDEVVKNTLTMFLNDYTYEKTTIEIQQNQLLFKATGNVEIDLGWKALLVDNSSGSEDAAEEETKQENIQKLPLVKANEIVQIVPKMKEGKTTAPKRYTEGDLLTVMKNAASTLNDEELQELSEEDASDFELGTEATRTSIIETLKQREYIQVTKNKVYVTPKGELLCKALQGTLLASAHMTAKWEAFLKMIGRGEQEEQTFIDSINKFILKTLEEAPNQIRSEDVESYFKRVKDEVAIEVCPLCKTANIIDKGRFYGCESKDCNQSFNKELLGKEITVTQLKRIISKKKSTLIKGFKGKKEFDAYIELEQQEKKFGYKLSFK